MTNPGTIVRASLACAFAILLPACGRGPDAPVDYSAHYEPPPLETIEELAFPDTSYVNQPYRGCRAATAPQFALSAAEQCWVQHLSARCDIGDDCLVSCLMAPGPRGIQGGCGHICFGPPSRIEWTPPRGLAMCKAIELRGPIGARDEDLPDC